jgi:hypothetical protein
MRRYILRIALYINVGLNCTLSDKLHFVGLKMLFCWTKNDRLNTGNVGLNYILSNFLLCKLHFLEKFPYSSGFLWTKTFSFVKSLFFGDKTIFWWIFEDIFRCENWTIFEKFQIASFWLVFDIVEHIPLCKLHFLKKNSYSGGFLLRKHYSLKSLFFREKFYSGEYPRTFSFVKIGFFLKIFKLKVFC